MRFSLRISSVTFTEEILNRKPNFLCSILSYCVSLSVRISQISWSYSSSNFIISKISERRFRTRGGYNFMEMASSR